MTWMFVQKYFVTIKDSSINITNFVEVQGYTSCFNHINNLDLVCRAHQLVLEGLKYMFQDKVLVTVWSAPNYRYCCGNVASISSFNENMEREVKFFTETEENNQMQGPRSGVSYFL